MNILRCVGRWFSLQGTVSRKEYLLTGLGLMLFKYAVEAGVIATVSGKFYSPLDFVNPLLSVRSQFIQGAPEWLGMAWVLWTIPFVWIAVSDEHPPRNRCRRFAVGSDVLVLMPVLNLACFMLAYLPTGMQSRVRTSSSITRIWSMRTRR